MITLDPRPAPSGAGVIRDILRPGSVVLRDPSGRHAVFAEPKVRDQISVRQLDDVVLWHVIRLAENVTFLCHPSWVSECPDGVVALQPVQAAPRTAVREAER